MSGGVFRPRFIAPTTTQNPALAAFAQPDIMTAGQGTLTLTAQVATNSFLYSEQFDNAAWSLGNLTVSANAVANPVNGASTADKLVENTANTQHITYQPPYGGTMAVGDKIAFSVYAKAAGRTVFWLASWGETYHSFDLSAGTAATAGDLIESLGSGWYRCTAFVTKTTTISNCYIGVDSSTNASSLNISYTGDGSSGIYVWGAQIQRVSPTASRPAPYIQTTSAAATGADEAQLNIALTAGKGDLTLTGQAETGPITMVAGKGDLTLTGKVATLLVATVMTANKGDLTLTGQSANLNTTMVAGKGDLTLTGKDIALAYASDPGTLTLQPKDAALVVYLLAGKGDLILTGEPVIYGFSVSVDAGTLTFTGGPTDFLFITLPGASGGGRRRGDGTNKLKVRQRTIEIEKDGRKKKVGYLDRFAPPPPPPPLELIPDWLFPDKAKPVEQPKPVDIPLLGYQDPLALKAEIEAAEDERDAMAILDMIEDPAIAELNAFLAQLSQ